MDINLADLSHFIDLGGIFILALIILNTLNKKVDVIEDKLTKILTILLIITKMNSKIDGVEKILGEDREVVNNMIQEAGFNLVEEK